MKNSYLKYYIMIIVAILMIVSGSISSLIIGIQEDKEETYKRMNDVSDKYDEFEGLITVFEDSREKLYETVLLNVTYENIYLNNKSIMESLSNYEAMVDEIYKEVNRLDNLCGDVYYPDSSINLICNNYKTIYEQVNNYFVTDINTYNKNVDNYNTYISNVNSSLKVKKYKTDKEYMDYDNDGEKVGKDEDKK